MLCERLYLLVTRLLEFFEMDPTLQQLAADLSTSFDALKSKQAAVAPLQATADAADAALTAGKMDIVTATADTDAKLQALIDYIHSGESPTPPPSPPDTTGGGSSPDQPVTGRRPIQARR